MAIPLRFVKEVCSKLKPAHGVEMTPAEVEKHIEGIISLAKRNLPHLEGKETHEVLGAIMKLIPKDRLAQLSKRADQARQEEIDRFVKEMEDE